MRALFCTSVPKIHVKYEPILNLFYGDAPVIEMYTATEGVFGQQLDDLPCITPNYDSYLFEVLSWRGIKCLHEMKRGEWGRLIVSTPLFPRYNIGDMIECLGKSYYRVFGRSKPLTIIEHMSFNLFTRWFL